jgi:hypothetical protein
MSIGTSGVAKNTLEAQTRTCDVAEETSHWHTVTQKG